MNKTLIKKYIEGTTTAVETTQVSNWYQHLCNEQEALLAITQDWHTFQYTPGNEDMKAILQQTLTLIDQEALTLTEATRQTLRKKITTFGASREKTTQRSLRPGVSVLHYAVAASIAIIAIIGVFLYTQNVKNSTPHSNTNTIEKRTELGQKLTITLPDYTRVILNAGSTLEYAENFNDNRELKLSGEAYFEVTQNEQKPFIVNSGSLKTTVLGTSFNINAYEEDIAVTVVTGKVKVEESEPQHPDSSRKLPKAFGTGRDNTTTPQNQYLTANEQTIYDAVTGEISKNMVEATNLIAWSKNKLIFERAAFEQVTQTLIRWYGTHITITGSPANDWQYTGSFDNPSLEHVLRAIQFGKGFAYEIDGKNVMINFKK